MTRTDEPLVKLGQDESLDRWMRHVYGDLKCRCDFAYKGLGRLHGVDMGKGWVRITTHPDCPHHKPRKKAKR